MARAAYQFGQINLITFVNRAPCSAIGTPNQLRHGLPAR